MQFPLLFSATKDSGMEVQFEDGLLICTQLLTGGELGVIILGDQCSEFAPLEEV